MELEKHKNKLNKTLRKKIWRVDLRQFQPIKRFQIKLVRVVMIVLHDFFRDKCVLRASALAFTTLLAIVPLAAVGFSLLKAFGVDETIRNWMLSQVAAGRKEVDEPARKKERR